MSYDEIQEKLNLSINDVIDYLHSTQKPKATGIGYCINGKLVGQKVFLNPNPVFKTQVLSTAPINNAKVISIFSTLNDIYVVETIFAIYIIGLSVPLVYALAKPNVAEQLEVIYIAPVQKRKNIFIQEVLHLVDNIYLVTTDKSEKFLLLSNK